MKKLTIMRLAEIIKSGLINILEMTRSSMSYCILMTAMIIHNLTISAQQADYETLGVIANLPVFYKKLAERQVYQLSWLQGDRGDFSTWRTEARNKIFECMLTPPPVVPFQPVVISEQDRGSYVARKIAFNVTGDSRVLAFMLVPKTKGPHPAILLLHDHGAKFDIGKEKVIEPWDEPTEKIASAKEFVKLCYGDRFIGDELAKRGYVCFATDMLNWSDRGDGGYNAQQALASNLFNLGSSFAGLIAFEDLQCAEFLSQQPEVDPQRIAAMGLSVGGFRTWQVAALSDKISAGVSVCWMSTYKALMVPGNNMVNGNSAYTMVHPGLSHFLDYPDVASVACPKPMMFCCGDEDDLFPPESIKEAFTKMRRIWESQNAGQKLVTKLYHSPHEYNLIMQTDAFDWLDKVLKNKR
jgi:dienelactone hydrolase